MIVKLQDVETMLEQIQTHLGPASEFKLQVPDAMNDPIGINMSLISDGILAKGWLPNGFEQGDGYRIYEYVEAADA